MTSMTKGILGGIVVVVLGTMVTGSPAHAQTPFVSNPGSMCRPYLGTTTSFVADSGGFQSTSVSNIAVTCPISLGVSPNQNMVPFTTVSLYYTDANAIGVFSCQLVQYRPNGSVFTAPVKYTSSIPGGSTASTTSYTGTGFLQWTAADLGTPVFPVDGSTVIKCQIAQNGGTILSYYSTN